MRSLILKTSFNKLIYHIGGKFFRGSIFVDTSYAHYALPISNLCELSTMRVCVGLIVHVYMCVCVHIISTVVSVTFVYGFYTSSNILGNCKTWTLDPGLDRGLDYGLDW